MSRIVVYTKPNCTRCAKAKQSLQNHGIDFTALTIGQDVDRETVLELFPGATQLPIITENGVRVLLEALIPQGPQLLTE